MCKKLLIYVIISSLHTTREKKWSTKVFDEDKKECWSFSVMVTLVFSIKSLNV